MNKSIEYPLLFTYTDCIAGKGFLAAVKVSGRALLIEEDGEWWMYGVQPAAIADKGKIPQEATENFHDRYKTVLFDFAEEASGFEEFKSETENFFNQKEEKIAASWENAFQLIRTSKVTPEEPFSQLPTQAPESRVFEIKVYMIDAEEVSTPSDNMLKKEQLVA